MEVLRFDFNGSSGEFRRTARGFLRVNARLSKTGVFKYKDTREYRSDEEVFRADSLESLKGAPVTDLHPKENGGESFITPENAKGHIIGITESIERDGPYLKGSLIIFHEDAIKAIESGDRKEISLGYKCRIDPTPGTINGEAYDAGQKDIIFNHVAIGPKNWGRAGPDCSIRTDSIIKPTKIGYEMDEAEIKKQLSEMQGRLDAANQEIEKKKAIIERLEDPKAISNRVNARIKLINQCQNIMGDDIERLNALSDYELKIAAIKKHYPDTDLKDKDQNYIDGMFEALLATTESRTDSIINTREAIYADKRAEQAYEKWLSYSANLWALPLTGSTQGGR